MRSERIMRDAAVAFETKLLFERGEKGSITHKITLNDKDTFYLKYGDAPFLIFSILTLLFGFYQRKNEE